MKLSICTIMMMYFRSWLGGKKKKEEAVSVEEVTAEVILYQDFMEDYDEGPIWF